MFESKSGDAFLAHEFAEAIALGKAQKAGANELADQLADLAVVITTAPSGA